MASSVRERLQTVQSTSVKAPCKAIASGNLTLSGEQTVDGRALVTGDRVLASAQTATAENGPWVVDSSSWTRPLDFNNEEEILSGVLVVVDNPSGDSGTYFIKYTGTLTLGTTALTVTASNLTVLDEDLFTSNSAITAPSQQSTKVYVDTTVAAHIIDEDLFTTDSATLPPSQQSVKAYVAAQAYSLPSLTGKADRIFVANSGETDGQWDRLSDSQIAYCMIKVNADENVAAGAQAKLANVTDEYDAAGIWNGTTKKVTAPWSGFLLINAWFIGTSEAAPINTQIPLPVIFKNGTEFQDWSAWEDATSPAESAWSSWNAGVSIAADDELELYAHNIDTDTAIIVGGGVSTLESHVTYIFVRGFY